MIKYAVILPSGQILQTGYVADADAVSLQGGDHLSLTAPEDTTDTTHWFSHDQQIFLLYPPKPFAEATFDFDTQTWVDARSAAEVEADLRWARTRATQAVNAHAAQLRLYFLTDIPGQDLLYAAKEAEARRWVADTEPSEADYPLLLAETGITAPTSDQLAQVWLNLAAMWRVDAARLERTRQALLRDIEAATSADEIAAVLDLLKTLDV